MAVENKRFRVTALRTEYQVRPLGLDIPKPRFSWRLEGDGGILQSACRVLVGTAPGGAELWDSGRVETEEQALPYGGRELSAKARHYVTVTVWDASGAEAEAADWFETGLLDPRESAWGGAKWIGAPERYLTANALGVFVLTSTVTLSPGSGRAGIIFGANDPRLMDANKNQYGLAGRSELRYVLNVEADPAVLEIYRVGFAKDDRESVPFAVVPLAGYEDPDKKPLITSENRYAPHEMRIEVPGNSAFFYLDGVLVDAVERQRFGTVIRRLPRQLNPLGDNDVTTFPRLCEVGYYAGSGDKAHFSGLTISHLRSPGATAAELGPVDLSGTDGAAKLLLDPSRHSLPMFRRELTVDEGKTLEAARLYITSRGIYDCRINGKPVTDTWLEPGNTQYDKRIVYQTYDVTEKLQKGGNGIGVTLASGWWCDAQTFVLQNYNYYGDRESFIALLELTYTDGTRESFVTNETDWDYFGEGPYVYAGLFQGEHLDRRRMRLYEDFSLPGFSADGMKKPVIVAPERIEAYYTIPAGFGKPWPTLDHAQAKLVGSYHAPVREVCRRRAVGMAEPRPGVYLYDMGQEMAGTVRVTLRGPAGTEVVLRYGEMPYPDLPEYGGLAGMILTENYRDAESIDRIILRGDPEGEVYCPRFTFHGYRYIEITGVAEPPAPEEVEGIQLSSVPVLTGHIETDNPLVNRFIENVRWSQYCNFISVPTDCPQRNERMGWAGDAHVFCRTATYQGDTRIFYYRYLEALRDLQEESGSLPDIAPMGGGFGGITYETAMIFMVWELYQQYGDRQVVEEFYGAMVRWLEYAHREGMPGTAFKMSLADWLAPVATDGPLLFNAFYGRAAQLMAKMAGVLGRAEDAARFAAWEAETRTYWNEKFVDPATGKTRGLDGTICDTQTSYALPLVYGIFSPENARRAQAHLERKTREVGCTVSTGFFGTGALCPALSEGGYGETAAALVTQTAFPSWLYPVTQGATTIWERWNSYTHEKGFGGNNSMNSFNHYSLGSVLSWYYEMLLGIRRDEEAPGYRHFTLAPSFLGFGRVSGGFDTPYGRVESAWERDGEGVCYRCTVPAGSTATLCLPGREEETLVSGTYTFRIA